MVAVLVFSQQQLVVALVPLALLAAERLFVAVLHHIKLAAHDGLHVVLVGLGHEVERPEHVAVVGEGHGRHPVGLGLLHQARNGGLPIEQRILSVRVQVRENGHASLN